MNIRGKPPYSHLVVFSRFVTVAAFAYLLVWGNFLKNDSGEIVISANGDVRISNPLMSDDVNLDANQIKAMWIADDYSIKLNKWYLMSFFVSEERPGRVSLVALKKEMRFPEVERLISLFSFPSGANTNRSMPSQAREVLYLAFLLASSNPSGSGLSMGDVDGAKMRAQAYL